MNLYPTQITFIQYSNNDPSKKERNHVEQHKTLFKTWTSNSNFLTLFFDDWREYSARGHKWPVLLLIINGPKKNKTKKDVLLLDSPAFDVLVAPGLCPEHILCNSHVPVTCLTSHFSQYLRKDV